MVNKIVLDDYPIFVKNYEQGKAEGDRQLVSVTFDVTSDDYHDVTTLLYKGSFDVKVPERSLAFKGTIRQYSTSFTNLYEKGNVGEFKLSLIEKS